MAHKALCDLAPAYPSNLIANHCLSCPLLSVLQHDQLPPMVCASSCSSSPWNALTSMLIYLPPSLHFSLNIITLKRPLLRTRSYVACQVLSIRLCHCYHSTSHYLVVLSVPVLPLPAPLECALARSHDPVCLVHSYIPAPKMPTSPWARNTHALIRASV